MIDRVRLLRTAANRATLAPVLVRVAVFLSALLSFAFAYPVPLLTGRSLLLLLAVAALPALAPRRAAPTVVVLVAVGGWLLATTGYGEPVVLWRLLGLAGFLYLTHTLAALAAALPYDAVVAPEMVGRWVARALGVLLGSAVLAVLLLFVAGRGGDRPFLAAALAGLAVAVAVAALLARLLRRG
ncbi:hypothetical protein SAMN05444365_103293 [Micromonospora pattaloongensis]|uniref:Uncharacterized protein n=1 Tax=Micromonospora pattaloongensis TaxID=405436 RepID=A0A1H3MBB4_9ACTN|nr:hypothetical protein [Micromonospora pattaloongensis]SDY73489.1 hypothetical protein SAMN05444365_103293 [Micromonospora pattaloongensis]